MKPERWQQVNELFQAALEREPGERARFVAEACAGDELLRREVESLIAFHDKGGSFMERPAVAAVAANLMSDEQDQLEVGQTLGHYQILDSLGAGGMGEVYLARDTKLGRKIALKLLPAYLSRDKDRLRRFEQEARVASTISHPNVAHIYEIGEANGHRFITMEYVEGVTLRQHTAQKELKLDRVLNMATQVADALGAAHMAGIVHRDIKPENIMVRPDGYIKVLDFGLAKIFQQAQEVESEAETEARFSTPGAILGTVPYMSPEQVRGEMVDGRSDIFSFGVVLYEMLSGRQPFASPSPAATVSAILTHEPPPLARYAADVPEELQRIVRKCLEKDRERRYHSARDLAIDLENIRRESSESARVRLSSEERSPVKTEFPEVAGTAKRPSLLASRRAIMAATVLVAVVALGIGYVFFRRAPVASAFQIKSLAVLPLQNLSGDPEQEYFADGMTEALTTELAKIGALRVISRTSVMKYKGARKPLPEIARELNVDAVVEGSVMRSGERVKITAQLIRAATDQHLWAESYERDLRDILALQSEVARGIANEIKIKVTPEEQTRLANARQVNPEAQEAYLKGRYQLGKGGEEDVRKATDYFQQAILKDPNYAQAYAGLADCYLLLGDFYLAPSETMPQAKEAAIKALELEETLAEAHSSLAGVRFFYDWDWVAAERECRRAIELNPNNARAHFRYANYLSAMGRHQEAIAESKRAEDLDPLWLQPSANRAWLLFMARQYDEAIGQGWKVIDIEPNFWRAHMFLGLAYEKKGKFPEAAAELEKAKQLSDSPLVLAMLGGVYAVSGRRAEAMKVLEELKDQAKRRFVCPYETATVYVGLGETEEAFKWLEQGYRDRSRCMVWLKVDPRLDSVRSDPRFADLMRRVGLTP